MIKERKIIRCFNNSIIGLKRAVKKDIISEWKSEGLCEESTELSVSLDPSLSVINDKIQVKFDKSCLKQKKITYSHKK